MKKIFAVFVVLSLLVVSASAADVYEIEDDTVVLSQPVAMYSLNSGASTFATGSDYSQDIYNLLVAEFDTNSLFMQFLRNIDQHTYSSMLSSSTISTNISVLLSFLSVSPNVQFLQDNNLPGITNQNVTFTEIVRQGILGLRNMSMVPSGTSMLAYSGTLFDTTGDWTFSSVMNHGFMGLRSLIAGSEADNTYDVSISGGDGAFSTIQAVGLGPMIQLYLDYMQDGISNLSAVLADSDDRDAKDSSRGFLKAITSSFLKSDSGGSLKSGSVTDLKDVSDGAADLFDSGYGVSDFFSELDNDSDFMSWFSAETATALDSSAQISVIDGEDLYDMSFYYDQLALIQSKRGEDTND